MGGEEHQQTQTFKNKIKPKKNAPGEAVDELLELQSVRPLPLCVCGTTTAAAAAAAGV
jgi:hypothetical protein